MGRHGVAEIATGVLVLVVAAVFLVFAVSNSGRSVGSGYTLYAQFAHIDGLNPGSNVEIAGVKVGSVSDTRIDPKSFNAVVTLSIRNDIQLPKDSGASINDESLLGGKYISLSPGGDPTNLKPGQTITITQSSISLEDLLGKFIFSVTSLNNGKGGGGGQNGNGQNENGQSGGSSGGGTAGQGGGGLPPLGK